MGFLDYVMAGLGVKVADSTPAPRKVDGVRNKTAVQKTKRESSMRVIPEKRVEPLGHRGSNMAIFCPGSMADLVEVVEFLSTHQPAMLNITRLDQGLAQRGMDFVVGATTALGATMEKVGAGLYLFAPKGTRLLSTNAEER